MIVVVQRCSKAQVLIDNETISQIDSGLMLLVGLNKGDEFSKFPNSPILFFD